MPDMQDKLAALDCIPVGGTPEELHAIMKTQMNQWMITAKNANIKGQ